MSAELQNSGEQNMEAAAPAEVVNEHSQSGEQGRAGDQSTVPLSALQSEREQRQQLQEELKMIKDHLALMQSNQQSSQRQPAKDEFDGLDDSDVLTLGEAKKLLGKVQQSYQSNVEELRMQQKHPDYQEVIQKYLPEVLRTNPELRRSLEKNPDYELAYHLAKNSESYRSSSKKQQKSVEAEKILQNSAQAGSLSSMGATTPISQAKRYKDMSEDEFSKLVRNNLGIV